MGTLPTHLKWLMDTGSMYMLFMIPMKGNLDVLVTHHDTESIEHNQNRTYKYRGTDSVITYPRERGPMGGAPYTGPRLGDGPIFEVSCSIAYIRERVPRS